jgi:outer membrane biosynthesis protein TonB
MLEIPGEEAPTDPGLEMRQKQEAAAARARRRRQLVGRVVAAMGLMAFAGAGGGVWWYLQLQAKELVYDMDEVYIPSRGSMVAAPPKEVAPAVSAAGGSGGGGRSTSTASRVARTVGVESGEALAASASVSGSGATTGPSGAVTFVPPATADVAVSLSEAKGTSRLGGVEIGVSRVGTDIIKDEAEIFAMAKETISAYYPQVETCVQQRLKVDESFSGRWRVEFTILTSGEPEGVRVSGLDTPDAELEACMSRAVRSWRFARIAHDFKVKKTYPFSGAG